MKNTALWLWQLPQHLLGLLLIRLLNAERSVWLRKAENYAPGIPYWRFKRDGRFSKFVSGMSLGEIILLPDDNICDITVCHEYGHSVQSLYLGWLYLPVIGIYSALFCNLWDRLFHKSWAREERSKWYGRWSEAWADRLGGVDREKYWRGQAGARDRFISLI